MDRFVDRWAVRATGRLALALAAAPLFLCGAGCDAGSLGGEIDPLGRPRSVVGADGGAGSRPPSPPVTTGDADICNQLDDDGDGQVDEDCGCTIGQSQPCWPFDATLRGTGSCQDGTQACEPNGEFSRWGRCEDAVLCDGTEMCEPENPYQAASLLPRCKDGADNDCDGLVDCSDPDCVVPGLHETDCEDAFDDDCDGRIDCDDSDCAGSSACSCGKECIPGTERWCDTPVACTWGVQECDPRGRWGHCREVSRTPAGCGGPYYDPACCVGAGECCQNFPHNDRSVGHCDGVVPPAC